MGSRVVRARLDEESERVLSILMREGRNESDAVRTALREAGRRRAQRSALAAEVSRLVADPVDTAERRAVMADMDAVAADWPASHRRRARARARPVTGRPFGFTAGEASA
jgi:hypothetical protein